MGLFKKDKKRDVSKLPELPKFEDDFGGNDLASKPQEGKVPSYESAFNEAPKLETGPIVGDGPKIATSQKEDYNIPVREPDFSKPKQDYTERTNSDDLDDLLPKPQARDLGTPFRNEEHVMPPSDVKPTFEKREEPKKIETPIPTVKDLRKDFKMPKVTNRPVFVQIDDYKDAMNSIELLKQKVREVEYTLDRLNEIKSQEQLEISNCETSLNKIKEKLVGIDKKLFEI